MLRKLIFRSKSGTEMRPTNDNHQSRHTKTAAFPSERPRSSPSVPCDSKASTSSSPLALHIVHQPDKLFGDIVFVHGFGASPYKTWTWNQDDQDSFWPAWLPDCDPTLATFRISTFGYNAKLKGSVTSLDIVDHAKDLLFALSAAFDSQDQSRSQPIIFIAHSLGGLIIKKAYTLGKHDEQYKGITLRVRGMIFLATPHRGSQYAKMLKNILSTAPAGTCSKDYIATLVLQTSTIQDINESFLIHCKDIKLCSVFETLRTHLTVRKKWLVDRDSAVLDYPNEQVVSMDANHHSICKYENRRSVNFVKIQSILLIWVAQFLEEGMYSEYARPPHKASTNAKVDGPPTALTNTYATIVESNVYHVLGIECPFDEPNASPSIGYSATCGNWLTENYSFKAWMASEASSVFMLVGVPGTGKTAISRSMIAHLWARGIDSQYHFFDESNQLKRAMSYCLRRIAAQLAMTNEEFRSALFKQHEQSGAPMTGLNQNAHALWHQRDRPRLQAARRRAARDIRHESSPGPLQADTLSPRGRQLGRVPVRCAARLRPRTAVCLVRRRGRRLLLIATRRRAETTSVTYGEKVQVCSRPAQQRQTIPPTGCRIRVIPIRCCASGLSGAAHWNLATGEEVGAVDESSEDKDDLHHHDDDDGFPVTNEEQDGPIMPDDRELPPVILCSCAVDSGRHRLVALSTYDKPYRSVFHSGAELGLLPLLGPIDTSQQINLGKETAVPRVVAAACQATPRCRGKHAAVPGRRRLDILVRPVAPFRAQQPRGCW
ncbi:NACHT and WD domain-containing protein [Beauveria brongniartii RCEF 3172]|uniref:NACHT and WD domain-containing protein n=1 Tax=Beauveria brongniartii RCEF 3172 TaxID=1081107 RepID=A0A167GKW3_9HYPO|nr:NACHT and WD domain-containing protein [Beauveria brongniartii RCEF 3172]